MSDRDRAEALMCDALGLIARRDWTGAAGALEQAAELHAASGREDEESRCLLGAATLRRASGDTEAARGLAGRAAASIPESLPMAVASLAERATSEATEGHAAQAAESFTAAL